MDAKALEELVRAVVRETLQDPPRATRPASVDDADACDDGCKPRVVPPVRVQDVADVRRVAEATPARLVQGRVGTRYTTAAYIGLRAEHAVALDAVHSSIPDDWAAKHGMLALKTRCEDLQQHLLYPDHGRRLDDASRALVEKEGTRGADVQVILGDGLAPIALQHQGARLLPALHKELQAQRFTVGKPLFVRHARIGVADEIGVLLGCKSTIIVVGERPGLGTGDSVSIYTAYKPRLLQDNAEKNCISNIRPLGLPPEQAALECAKLMRRTFDAGGGGVHLVRPIRDLAKRQAV